MKKLLILAAGLLTIPLFTSCTDYSTYGSSSSYGAYGDGYRTSYSRSTAYAPLSVGFISTSYDRWAYDPYRRCYYDRQIGRYYNYGSRSYYSSIPRRYSSPYYPRGYRKGYRLPAPSYLPRGSRGSQVYYPSGRRSSGYRHHGIDHGNHRRLDRDDRGSRRRSDSDRRSGDRRSSERRSSDRSRSDAPQPRVTSPIPQRKLQRSDMNRTRSNRNLRTVSSEVQRRATRSTRSTPPPSTESPKVVRTRPTRSQGREARVIRR